MICSDAKECPISDECPHGESHEHNKECEIKCSGAIEGEAECEEE